MSDGRYEGIYPRGKYDVRRKSDPEGKHDNCWFFVLDIKHDPHAVTALTAYAESCGENYPQLRWDLLANIKAITGTDPTMAREVSDGE